MNPGKESRDGGSTLEVIDYLAIGHPTIDVRPTLPPIVGGSAVYATLLASQFGYQSIGIGCGNVKELTPLIEPFEMDFQILPSPHTIQFENITEHGVRHQRIENWPGPIDLNAIQQPARVIHLAPVAREFDLKTFRRNTATEFVGITPQGLLRSWDEDRNVYLQDLGNVDEVAQQIDAVVVSESEESYTGDLLRAVASHGGVAVVTHGVNECVVHTGTQVIHKPAWRPVEPIDDTGAGDVFAAALFVELANGSDLDDALSTAHCAAALSLLGEGPFAIPSREEVAFALHDVPPT